MAEEHRLPDADQVDREASEWIARLNADDASDSDRADYEAWRRTHPEHARAYDDMCVIWRRCTAAGPLVRATAFGESMHEVAQHRWPPLRRLLTVLRSIRRGQ